MKKLSSFMLACIAVLSLFACDKNLSGDELLSNAKVALAQGNHQAAIIELKNAVKIDPGNAETRLLLGTVYLDTGEFESAEKELQRARDNRAADDKVVPPLAEVLQALGKHSELMQLDGSGVEDPEGRATLLAAQGVSTLAQGDVWQASELIEAALATAPESPHALLATAMLAQRDGSTELARQHLGRALEIDPQYAAAWRLLGTIEWRAQQLKQAEDAFTRSISFARDNSTDLLQRALVRIQAGNFAAAQEDVDVLLQRFTRHPGASYAQGLIHLHNNDIASAKTSFDTAALAERSYPLTFFYLASIHAGQGNLAQAETNVAIFLSIVHDNPWGLKLSASLQLRAENYTKAEKLVRPVVNAFPDDVTALNLLANSLSRQGKSDGALALLSRVVELQPDSAVARSRIGQELLAAGQQAVALEHLKAAVQLDPKFQQADTILILNYLRQKDFVAAIKAGEDYRRRNPTEVGPYNLLGQVYLAAQNDEDARKAFQQVLKLAPGDPNANHGLAFLAEQVGDTWEARSYYTAVLEQHKNYLPTLMKLSALDAMEGNEEAMLEGLQRAIELHPDAVEPRLVLSRYYVLRGQSDRAIGLFNELDVAVRLQPVVAQLLAKAELEQRNYPVARHYLERLIEQQPDVAANHYQLAMTYAGEGDSGNTRAELEKAIEIDRDHLPARIALARFLLLGLDIPGLEQQVIALRRIAPENSDVLQLEGVLSTLKKDPQGALKKMQLAYEGNPSTATLLTLARHQNTLGNAAAARSLMQDWLSGHEADVFTRIALAELYILEENQEDAIAEFQRVLQSDARNVTALNNLAWYLRHSDPGAALSHAELASQISPGSAQVLDTLAVVLLANRKFDLAQRTITRAIALNPRDPSQHYHAAQIEAASGNTRSAVAILAPLLQTGAGFPERDAAIGLLADLQQ